MRLFLGLVLSASLLAQPPRFRQLATTDDGARVYFSSPLDRGGRLASYPKVFAFDAGGLHVLAQNSFPMGWPSASGDGAAVAYSGQSGGRFQGNVARADGSVFFAAMGQVVLSRNGRYAMFARGGDSASITVVDLLSGDTSTAAVDGQPGEMLPLASGGRAIASDGMAVVRGAGEIQIIRNGGVQPYQALGVPVAAVIDEGGNRVVYECRDPRSIVLLDLGAGTQTVLAQNATQPSLSSDGQLLLYLSSDSSGVNQPWIMGPDSSGARQLASVNSGITEAVLSGDGSTAYAITGDMRLLRIDVASGETRDLTPAILAAGGEPPAIIFLTLSPAGVNPGGTAQLCYSVANAATISIAPGIGTVEDPQGCATVSPGATTTYTLTAMNSGGSVRASVTLVVGALRVLSFTNDPAYSPAAASPVTLRWTTANAASVTITGPGVPGGTLPVNGSIVVNPVSNTTYTLTAYGTNGEAASAVVYVFVR